MWFGLAKPLCKCLIGHLYKDPDQFAGILLIHLVLPACRGPVRVHIVQPQENMSCDILMKSFA